jgi:arylsulfatase A-like enzyme
MKPHSNRPNVVFLMTDQLASQVLSLYGADVIDTPHIDRLAAQGVTFDNMISTCPVCTPYRSMWLTGRHPQTTGHLLNFVNTRHDEIGWGDVFAHAGYDTGYVGKWHLHRGSFPQIDGADYVPEGRDRLGFRWWRGYNFHTDYFNGTINTDGEWDWMVERWSDYETQALNRYAFEFLDEARERDKPFCLLVNPHQPHITGGKFAPEAYYERLPDDLGLPPNWNGGDAEKDQQAYRHYLAMILAVDDMLGELRAGLEQRGLIDNTIFVFTSDHGTHMGTHGETFWGKKMPWEENVKVPFIIHWPALSSVEGPGVFEGGGRCNTLTAPVDLLPTFCGLCGVPIPKTVEGHDLSAAWRGEPDAFEQDAVLMMNFLKQYDRVMDGWEWRGVRTQTHTYARFLDGKELLFDHQADPAQAVNLAEAEPELREQLSRRMHELMKKRGDKLQPASAYKDWFDNQRRVVANAYGPLPHPDEEPDWSRL